MFTDIVGYTTLMGKDEGKAMELVHRSHEIQKQLVEEFEGDWLKEMGDGVMCSFRSVSDAIYCALEIQEHLFQQQDLQLRIGIHLGEVLFENGDIFSDGVNIASRLQAIAEPGGIYLSESVQKAIRGQTDIHTVYLGEMQLKNVDYRVKTYALRGEGIPPAIYSNQKRLSGRIREAMLLALILILLVINAFTIVDWDKSGLKQQSLERSIAVLPFYNLSSDPQQSFFLDGLQEDILTQLSKSTELDVKSRTSTLKYRNVEDKKMEEIGLDLGVGHVLEGSIRRVGNKVRLTAQLIDVHTDSHMWSEVYDREISDVLATQQELALDIAHIITSRLLENEFEYHSTKWLD